MTTTTTAMTITPLRPHGRQADFSQLQKVLRKERPDRFTLFEFFLNDPLYDDLSGERGEEIRRSSDPDIRKQGLRIPGFYNAGYDYATLHASDFGFPRKHREKAASYSSSHGGIITDRASFEDYVWPDPEQFSTARLEKLEPYLIDGMKIIVCGPCGMLENAVALVGYEELCFMIIDEPELAGEIFDHIGSRLLNYYEIALEYGSVGAIISNDDWGFNTQTMLAPADMRRYVFPWHKKIAAAAHAKGKPAILHSCGYMQQIWDDVIGDMNFDAKHSYEDNIQPVEDAYEQVQGRIAVLGGIDLDFVCRRPAEEVYRRCRAMLERAKERGGYALGTGNSIPEYVPREQYFAMVRAALDA